jgi:hypothetical protein
MDDTELADLVSRSLSADALETFERRVGEQAETLRGELGAGRFENEAFSIGLELEAYVVDEAGRLATVPESVFEAGAANKELGLHNVELNTDPDPFDADGLASQAERIRDEVAAAREALDAEGLGLALDAMWTVPPPEGTRAYLSAVEETDGVTVAANMRRSPRYCAIDNDLLDRSKDGIPLEFPGCRERFPTILVESLTTSIQPHLQVPDLDAFPAHHGIAVRTLGPVLALATNSPFLPADLYASDPADPREVVERTPHELRVRVFEQSINVGDGDPKVRFPQDIDRSTDVVDRLVEDRSCAPFLKEWLTDPDAVDAYADRVWELDHKRGTYWRWLRAVAGGDPVPGVTERSVRIEYRPLPTQPTVADVVGLQALVVGLVRGLVAADHPLASLEWSAARRSFYGAVDAGLDAELAWVDADGERTTDRETIYREVFTYARRGLREQGVPADDADDYLAPIEARWSARTTPSRWKKATVRDRLEAGADLRTAIEETQRAYLERSREGEPFADW